MEAEGTVRGDHRNIRGGGELKGGLSRGVVEWGASQTMTHNALSLDLTKP